MPSHHLGSATELTKFVNPLFDKVLLGLRNQCFREVDPDDDSDDVLS